MHAPVRLMPIFQCPNLSIVSDISIPGVVAIRTCRGVKISMVGFPTLAEAYDASLALRESTMASSLSRIGSPEPSSLSSVYQDAPESCAQTDVISNKESAGHRYGSARRTTRTRIDSVSSSEHSSIHRRSPYRSQRLKYIPRVRSLY